MKYKKGFASLMVFFLCWINGIGVVQEKGSKAKTDKEIKKSLIRKELLVKKRNDPKIPRRNIFFPTSSGLEDGDVESVRSPLSLEAREGESEDNLASSLINLRYIGYIDSGRKIVALIIFEGEAISVEEGEKISEQITVGKITTEEIEVIGLDGIKIQFALEGEGE